MLHQTDTFTIPNHPSVAQFQFVHEASFAPSMGQGRPSKTGVRGPPKWSSAQVLAEALRLPGHVQHIAKPMPPVPIFGIDPSQLVSWHDDLVVSSRSKLVPSRTGLRRQRSDTPILLGVIASFPGPYDPTSQSYLRWRELVIEWVLSRYGNDRVAYGLEHGDESTGHLHFGIHNHGASVKFLMAGPMAVAHAEKLGVPRQDYGAAYRRGCQLLQDEFQKKVGGPCGLGRISPNPRGRRDRTVHLHARAAQEFESARLARQRAETREKAVSEVESELASKCKQLEQTKVALAALRDSQALQIRESMKLADRRVRAKLAEADRLWQEASDAKEASVVAAVALRAANQGREVQVAEREKNFMQLIAQAFPDALEQARLLRRFGLLAPDHVQLPVFRR